jgi:hypothetical protein
MRTNPREERDREFYQQRLAGLTYAAIGKQFGLSGERVAQIVRKQERKERYRRMREEAG